MTDTQNIADRARSSEPGRRPDKKPSPAVSGVGPRSVASFETMVETASALAAPGKGILAADESTPTMARGWLRSGWSQPSSDVVRIGRSCSHAGAR
jgi:hypothetical protein